MFCHQDHINRNNLIKLHGSLIDIPGDFNNKLKIRETPYCAIDIFSHIDKSMKLEITQYVTQAYQEYQKMLSDTVC
jgi:hypothetical protein